MGFLSVLTQQLGILLKSQSTASRLMLLLIIIGSIGGMAWLALHAKGGSYTALYSNMQSSDGMEAMAKLRQIGIEAKLENGGTTLMVPANKADDAAVLLSMENIPGSGTIGFEAMDKTSIGQTKFQQEKNYHRMREGELARTLLSIHEIEHARVHLALPESSVFVKDEHAATASVVLTLHRGATLNERQLNGIVHLVSRGIEGLKPEDVSIIDSYGNLLNSSKPDNETQASLTQQSLKTQYEDLLKSRIESMLEPVIGRGKLSARVQADFDFSTMHQITETFNPDEQEQQIRMQKISREGDGKAVAGVSGVPGSTSNMPDQAAGPRTGQAPTSSTTAAGGKLDMTTDYALSRKWAESNQTIPTPQRVTVAVLVDGTYKPDSSGKKEPEYIPRTAEELKKVEDLVKATIGFSDKRKDLVTVECAQFQTNAPDQEKEPWWNNYQLRQMLPLGIQWGVIGLVSLLLILMVLRPAIKNIMVTPATPAYGGLLAAPGRSLGGEGGSGGAHQLGSGAKGAAGLPEMLRNSKLGELTNELAGLESALDGMDDEDIPDEIRGNQEAMRAFKMSRMATQQARLTQAEAQKIQQEVVDTAKNNPQKTVSLLRQWMDEA